MSNTRIDFTLVNGERYNSDSNTLLLLIPELLEKNIDVIKNWNHTVHTYHYQHVGSFHEGLAKVMITSGKRGDEKYGFMNKEGKEVIPCIYGYAHNFHEGLAAVERHGRCGFIDKEGKEVIPCIYATVTDFHEGLAIVKNENDEGMYIDSSGRVVISSDLLENYNLAGSFYEGLAVVRRNTKYGFINKEGREVIACDYDYAHNFYEGLAVVERDGRYGFIDKAGKEVIPCIYTDVTDFHEGLAIVTNENGKRMYINQSGGVVISDLLMNYKMVGEFHEGLAVVQRDGKYGFIDQEGKEVIPCIYGYAHNFHEGLAVVEVNGKCGFINREGKEVIPGIYYHAFGFSEGLASVKTKEGHVFINQEGKEVISCIYDNRVGQYDFMLQQENLNFIMEMIKNLTNYFNGNAIVGAFDLRTNTVSLVEQWSRNVNLETKMKRLEKESNFNFQ